MHVRAIPTYSLYIADLLKGMIIQVLSQLQSSVINILSRAHDDIIIMVAEEELHLLSVVVLIRVKVQCRETSTTSTRQSLH